MIGISQSPIFQCNGDDGPLTRQEPLNLHYLEEWRFRAGHYKSVIPNPSKQNFIAEYILKHRSYLSLHTTSATRLTSTTRFFHPENVPHTTAFAYLPTLVPLILKMLRIQLQLNQTLIR